MLGLMPFPSSPTLEGPIEGPSQSTQWSPGLVGLKLIRVMLNVACHSRISFPRCVLFQRLSQWCASKCFITGLGGRGEEGPNL